MPVFLDYEASGLHGSSYPIEVGWARSPADWGATLIRPARGWLGWGWDEAAERIHGITREDVVKRGLPPGRAADLLLEAAAGEPLYSDNMEHDRDWTMKLFRAAGMQAPEVRDANVLIGEAARAAGVTQGKLTALVRLAGRDHPHVHRAGPDARRLAAIYELVAAQGLPPRARPG
jgi:hypothetical protein